MATARRRRKPRAPKTAAQIAASKRNLEKARAARSRAASAKKKTTSTAKKKRTTSTAKKKVSFKRKSTGSATVTKRVNAVGEKWKKDPFGAYDSLNKRMSSWSRGEITDSVHWTDRALRKAHDKKGRSNAFKLEAYLSANPRKKMRDPRKSLEAQARARVLRKKRNAAKMKKGIYGFSDKTGRTPETIYSSSANGTRSTIRKKPTKRRRRRST